MRRKGMLVFGGLLTLYGVLLLVGEVLHIDIGKLCFPLFLIILGLLLAFRPRLFPNRPDLRVLLFPDIRRSGQWMVKEDEILMFIGDINLDLSQADIPSGETTLHAYGFIGDIDIRAPADVGVSVASSAFLTSARLWNQKQNQFVSLLKKTSPNYAQAEKKFRLETVFFIADLRVD